MGYVNFQQGIHYSSSFNMGIIAFIRSLNPFWLVGFLFMTKIYLELPFLMDPLPFFWLVVIVYFWHIWRFKVTSIQSCLLGDFFGGPKFQEALADCVHQVKDKSPWWLLAYSIFHQNSCETWIDLVQKRWGRWEDWKVIVCIFCVCILYIIIVM